MTSAARACLRATFWGSMTGGGPFLIITIPFGISISKSGDLLGTLVVALLPLIVSGTVVTGLIWGRWREARRTSQETFS